MNDLDMVRDLRSQVRQSDESDLRGARRRVLAAMAPKPRGRRLSRPLVRVAAVGVLGVTIAAGVTIVQNLPAERPSAPAWLPVANAETLAKRATAAAAGQADVYPRDDQWVYARRDFYRSPRIAPTPAASPKAGAETGSRHTTEMWTRGDGKERALREAGSETITRRQGGEDPRRRFDPAYLRSLPLEPAVLRERLRKDTKDIPLPEARAVFGHVLTILQEGAPAARLRAALYTVLSQLDGVGVEKVSDLLGREGVGIYIDDEGIRREVIIDPNTYVLLGGRTVYVGGSASPPPYGALPEGEVIFAVAQVAAGIVDHAGEVPR
ncbi:CU044_5270 family protein [Nonomuraea sp. NPDC050394]|uniref:CU044_5270 family protein n=1 Tax=Nonomuraea sp. NPDC050394 TaxID=3364363 RepID=UPI003798A28D